MVGVALAVQDALAEAGDGKAPKLQAVGCAVYHGARFSVDIAGLIRTRLRRIDPELDLSDEELAVLFVSIRSLSHHHGACAVKAYLGGWSTSGRLHLDQCDCVFGCHGELDDMRHCIRCHVLQHANVMCGSRFACCSA